VENIMNGAARIGGRASVLGLVVFAFTTSLALSDIAVRCAAHLCVYVRCNETGNRCHRISRAEGSAYVGREHFDPSYSRGGRFDRNRGVGRNYQHTACDEDGERCYRSSEREWNYRDYYRGLGYRWIASDDKEEGRDVHQSPTRGENRYDRNGRAGQQR
jgi:hypothetical protein